MKVSSVSPERWETNCRVPAARQMAIASSVSVTVPIWLSLISAALRDAAADGLGDDGRVGDEVVVADQLDASPSRAVSAIQPSQSSSARPSSIECTGNRVDDGRLAAR